MSAPLPPPSPFGPAPASARRLKPVYMAAIAAVSVAALGIIGLKFVNLPDAAPVAPGDALKIEVVAPVEPKLAPGSVMDVGELVDGYRYVAPRRSERAAVYDAGGVDERDSAPWSPPSRPAAVRRYVSTDAPSPSEPEAPRRERERRWFGFDNPLPDFGAERRAREARLDALEERRRAEFEDRAQRRRYSSDPPRYEDRRTPGSHYNPPRDDPPVNQPSDGPYGPEVG